jgi:hypothetical protein
VERAEQRTVLGYDQRKRAAQARRKGKAAGSGKKTESKGGSRRA